ncbi:MAG: DUF4129 domain-containing protein [Chloroflexota bacterium]|nr:DUF4129 domain-containing protein [Dehalococcoidia bacterium]MDW8255077.1 DUF4129 domain-containing protein [Chloroflexota bacterium]
MILRPVPDLLLPVLLAIGEVTWLSLWFRLVAHGPNEEPLVPLGLLVLTAVTAALLMRWASRAVWSLRRLRWTTISAGVAMALAVVTLAFGPDWLATLGPFIRDPLFAWPPAVLALVMAGITWWRGQGIGDRPIDTLEAEERFRTGAIALVLLAIAAPIATNVTDVSTVIADLPGASLLFFTTGLTTLAIARLRALQARGPRTRRTAPRWALTTAATIGLVIVTGLTVIAVIPEPLGGLGRVLAPLIPFLRILDPIFLAILLPIALLLERIFVLFGRFLSRFSFAEIFQNLEQTPPEEMEERLRNILEIDLIMLGEWLIFLALLALVAAIVWRSYRKRVRRKEDERTEERDSVWSWREFFAGLWAWLVRLRRRLRPPAGASVSRSEPPVAEEARSIRAIYRAYLRAGAAIGLPRRPEQTPLEYLNAIAPKLGEGEPFAAAITAGYHRARYAEQPPAEADVREVQAAWEALRSRLLPPAGS